MSILENLKKASFRGVEFLISTATTDGGRKVVTHEYPNTDRRFVEDLGRLQKVFTVEGFINQPDYFGKRNRLINALEQPGIGILSHPFFGDIRVVARPYSISENMSNIGTATVRMTFERSDVSIFPQITGINEATIASKVDTVTESSGQSILDDYQTPTIFDNFQKAQNKLANLGAKFREAARKVSQATEAISNFNATITQFERDLSAMTATPQLLVSNLESVFAALSNVAQTDALQIEVNSTLFNFGEDDPEPQFDTANQREVNNNFNVINNAVNAQALAYSYLTASQIEYGNTEEVDNIQNSIETQYSFLEEENVEQDLFRDIEDLRVDAQEFFNNIRLNVSKITTINTNKIPATVLAYNYYGNIDNTESIITLNNIRYPVAVEGDIRILTA